MLDVGLREGCEEQIEGAGDCRGGEKALLWQAVAAAMHQNCLPKDKMSNGRTAAPISPVALFLPLPSEPTGP